MKVTALTKTVFRVEFFGENFYVYKPRKGDWVIKLHGEFVDFAHTFVEALEIINPEYKAV